MIEEKYEHDGYGCLNENERSLVSNIGDKEVQKIIDKIINVILPQVISTYQGQHGAKGHYELFQRIVRDSLLNNDYVERLRTSYTLKSSRHR